MQHRAFASIREVVELGVTRVDPAWWYGSSTVETGPDEDYLHYD